MYRTLLSLTLFTLLLLGTSPALGQTTYTVSSGDSIQDAIDNAENGDTIEVEDGTYQESLTISKALTIQAAAGVNAEDITIGGVADACRDINITSNNVTLDGISVSGAQGAAGCDGGEAVISVAGVENITITGVQVTGPGASDKTGINLFNSDTVTIENTEVTQAGKNGINVRSRNVTLRNITAPSNAVGRIGFGAVAVYANNKSGADPNVSVTFDGTINLSDNPNGLIFIARDAPITATAASATFAFDNIALWPLADFGSQQDVTVDGGGLDAFAQSLILNAKALTTGFALYQIGAEAAATRVAQASNPQPALVIELPTGDYFVGQESPSQTMSVQTALNNVPANGTVNVLPGTYEESITIDKALTIQAAAGASPKPVIIGQSTDAVRVEASDVTISGLDIQNPEGGGDAESARNAVGIRVLPNSTNVTISGNHIQNIATDVETNPLGIVAFDGADNLTIQDNTLQNLEGTTDEYELQAQAILLIQESESDPTAITDALIKGNTITNVSDARSAVAIRFNGDVQGTIEDNTISSLFTTVDDPNQGFTQAIAFAEGGNGNAAPSNVTIKNNTISDLEDNGTDNLPPSHIIFTNVVAPSTVTITDNTLTAITPNEGYVMDVTGPGFTGTKDAFDLSSILAGNTYTPAGEIIENIPLPDGSTINAIVPGQPATDALVRAENGEKPADGEKLFVATGTSQQGNPKSYLDDIDGVTGNRVEGETLGTSWWLDTNRSWQVDWDASEQQVTFTIFSDDMWSTQADQISSTFAYKTFNGDPFDFAGLSIGARTTNDDDTVTYSAVQFDDGNGFKAVPEANASYTGGWSHNFFAFAETFDAKASDFSLRGQMLIEGTLTSSDNPRFDIKAVQVPPSAECLPPDLVENRDGIPDGFITVTAEDQAGVKEVAFVDEHGNPALTNFEASTEDSAFEPLDEGITFTLKPGATAPTTVEFKLTAVPPEGTEPGESFSAGYFVKVENGCGSTILNDPVHTLSNSSANELAIRGNYPNPFVASTTVEFGLPNAADVRLAVYDVMGRQVTTLIDGPMQAGTHEVTWDGRVQSGAAAASGVYILRLQVDGQQAIHRVSRVR